MTTIPGSASEEKPERVQVHVVDDDPAMRTLVVKILETDGLEAIPHASGPDFLSRLDSDGAGCVVLDLMMPQSSGLDVLRTLREDHPDLPVVMISGKGDIPKALESLRIGALDFLEKPFRPAQLVERVRQALAIARQRREQLTRARQIQRRIDSLTPREAELLPLFQHGRSVKEIAFELGLSPKTVQVHRSKILRVMQVPSLVDLTNLMHELEEIRRDQGS